MFPTSMPVPSESSSMPSTSSSPSVSSLFSDWMKTTWLLCLSHLIFSSLDQVVTYNPTTYIPVSFELFTTYDIRFKSESSSSSYPLSYPYPTHIEQKTMMPTISNVPSVSSSPSTMTPTYLPTVRRTLFIRHYSSFIISHMLYHSR